MCALKLFAALQQLCVADAFVRYCYTQCDGPSGKTGLLFSSVFWCASGLFQTPMPISVCTAAVFSASWRRVYPSEVPVVSVGHVSLRLHACCMSIHSVIKLPSFTKPFNFIQRRDTTVI